MSKAHTDAEAIAAVKRALHEYAERVAPTAAAAEREMSAVSEEVSSFLEECGQAIARLEDDIRILQEQEEPDETLLQEKRTQLKIWTRRRLDSKHLQAQLLRDHAAFRGHQRRYTNAIEPLANRGGQRMRRAREDVLRYEKNQQVQNRLATRSWRAMAVGGAMGSANAASWASPGGVSALSSSSVISGDAGGPPAGGHSIGASDDSGPGPGCGSIPDDPSSGRFATDDEIRVNGLPEGMSLVPLSRCIDDGRVKSAADFNPDKATAEDCIWAVRALYRDVLPRMSRGGEVTQRLRDTDVGRGLAGNQSLQATFSGFFGADDKIIKVSQLPDGTYDVRNGAHRIWAARQIGVTHIPASVWRSER